MERIVWVEFGPSRSKRFARAVAEAENGAGECIELEPGRYQVRFTLEEDAAPYTSLARLLGRVRGWRASEAYDQDGEVSVHHAKEMAWCAATQLTSFRACRFRFYHGVLPRCSLCPLFDSERAIHDLLGENPPPGTVFEISLGPNLSALLEGRLPPTDTPAAQPDWHVPDYPPHEWTTPQNEEPTN